MQDRILQTVSSNKFSSSLARQDSANRFVRMGYMGSSLVSVSKSAAVLRAANPPAGIF